MASDSEFKNTSSVMAVFRVMENTVTDKSEILLEQMRHMTSTFESAVHKMPELCANAVSNSIQRIGEIININNLDHGSSKNGGK